MDDNANSQTSFQDALRRLRADLASPRRAELVKELLDELTAEVSPRRQRRDPISRLLEETLDALSRAYRDGKRAPRAPLLVALFIAGGFRMGRVRASTSPIAVGLVSQAAILAANVAVVAVLAVGMSMAPSIGLGGQIVDASATGFVVGEALSTPFQLTTTSPSTGVSHEVELLTAVDSMPSVRARASIEVERSVVLGVRRSVEVDVAGRRAGVEGVTVRIDCDPRSKVKSSICEAYDLASTLGASE